MILVFYESIDRISGIGSKRKQLFEKIGISNICDLLYHFPRKLDDRSNVKKIIEVADGEYVTLKVTPVGEMNISRIKGNLTVFKICAFFLLTSWVEMCYNFSAAAGRLRE